MVYVHRIHAERCRDCEEMCRRDLRSAPGMMNDKGMDNSELFRIRYSATSVRIQRAETRMAINWPWQPIYRQLLGNIKQRPIPVKEGLVKQEREKGAHRKEGAKGNILLTPDDSGSHKSDADKGAKKGSDHNG